jgi:hypothetical protein
VWCAACGRAPLSLFGGRRGGRDGLLGVVPTHTAVSAAPILGQFVAEQPLLLWRGRKGGESVRVLEGLADAQAALWKQAASSGEVGRAARVAQGAQKVREGGELRG